MPSSDLAFALELADLADSRSLPRFRALDLRIETKPDLTPVTDADRVVERALRERVAVSRPGEGVVRRLRRYLGSGARPPLVGGTSQGCVPGWGTNPCLSRVPSRGCLRFVDLWAQPY